MDSCRISSRRVTRARSSWARTRRPCRRPTSWRRRGAPARRRPTWCWGRARTAGYYLIGLRAPAPELFVDMPWSTATVCEETLATRARGRAPGLRLATWFDMDRVADLARLRRRSGAGCLSAPADARLPGGAWRGDAARPPRRAAGGLWRVRGSGRLAGLVRAGLRLFLDPAPGHGDDGPRRVELDRDLAAPSASPPTTMPVAPAGIQVVCGLAIGIRSCTRIPTWTRDGGASEARAASGRPRSAGRNQNSRRKSWSAIDRTIGRGRSGGQDRGPDGASGAGPRPGRAGARGILSRRFRSGRSPRAARRP